MSFVERSFVPGSMPIASRDWRNRSRPYSDLVKQPFEILLIMLGLPFVLPLMLVVWCVITASGGDAIFSQTRIGLNGRPFKCFKFRTMVRDAETQIGLLFIQDPARLQEWLIHQKITNDPRVTRFGRFLRRTSIDELPQLFNVLRGEMSLVGPRPFTAEQTLPYFQGGGRAYFDVRPGLTGPWQITGRGKSCFLDRISFDEAYVRTLSFTRDIGILWKTIGAVFRGTGS